MEFVLRENTRMKISEQKGRELKLVGRLDLKFLDDICSDHLMIPVKYLLSLTLNQNETDKLANVGDTMVVKLIEPEGETCSIKLVKKGRLMYALGSEGEGRDVVSRNRLSTDVPIDLWAFLDGEATRWFVMEYVHGVKKEGAPAAAGNTITN